MIDHSAGRRRRVVRLLTASAVSVVLIVGATAGPAVAEEEPPPVPDPGEPYVGEPIVVEPEPPPDPSQPSVPGELIATIQVEMGLDCVNMDADAKAYADSHGLCPQAKEGTGDPGAPSPNGVRWGNCGMSYIYAYNFGRGRALIEWGFWSVQGAVVRRNLVVGWLNKTTYRFGYFIDSNWMYSSYYWNAGGFQTGWGRVRAWLSGSVRLVWGGTCVVLNPETETLVI